MGTSSGGKVNRDTVFGIYKIGILTTYPQDVLINTCSHDLKHYKIKMSSKISKQLESTPVNYLTF